MKLTKLAIIAILLLLLGYVGYYAYLHSLRTRRTDTILAHHQLVLPREIKLQLTNGTTDAVPWLEQYLHAPSGRIPALYLLDWMSNHAVQPLPEHEWIGGFCGNSSTLERERVSIARADRFLQIEQQALDRYAALADKSRFRPFPRINWSDPLEIESRFLGAIENQDAAMLVLLQETAANISPAPCIYPRDDRRIRFHRLGNKYDVREVRPGDRIIRFDLAAGSADLMGSRMWLAYWIKDHDGDGLIGVAGFQFFTEPTGPTTQPASQPQEQP